MFMFFFSFVFAKDTNQLITPSEEERYGLETIKSPAETSFLIIFDLISVILPHSATTYHNLSTNFNSFVWNLLHVGILVVLKDPNLTIC